MLNKLKQLAEMVYKEHNTKSDKILNKNYDLDNITMYVYHKENLITITALNIDTQRQIDITAKKYSKLFKSYNTIAKISYSLKDLPKVIIELEEEEKKEVKKEIRKLNSEINKNISNEEQELMEYLKNKFGNEFVNETKKAIEQLETIKAKRSKAGRKQKFDKKQIDKILQLREEGTTIKELSIQFGCGVATIHKLISENK